MTAMSIVARSYSHVIGVDTHARTHTVAIIAASTGERLIVRPFAATGAGMARLIAFVARVTGTGPDCSLWVIEGIGSYGARLAHQVTEAGYPLVEAMPAQPRAHQRGAKSDELDAIQIATSVLGIETGRLRQPRHDDGVRAALRVLITARDQMTSERTASVNMLNALARTVDLGLDARRALSKTQIAQIASWRARDEPIAVRIARTEAIRLATRIKTLDQELEANTTTLTELVQASPAAPLLNLGGIGPVTAAIALICWSHPGRLRSEAAFAALAGVNPIPASSGNTTRHRLNRGGDRRLNRALHMVITCRMSYDPATRDYMARRQAEGRTTREIRRSLKRYLARQIYRTLNNTPTPTPA